MAGLARDHRLHLFCSLINAFPRKRSANNALHRDLQGSSLVVECTSLEH